MSTMAFSTPINVSDKAQKNLCELYNIQYGWDSRVCVCMGEGGGGPVVGILATAP